MRELSEIAEKIDNMTRITENCGESLRNIMLELRELVGYIRGSCDERKSKSLGKGYNQ